MGFESSFTLYRKYDTKVSENTLNTLIKKYLDEYRKDHFDDSITDEQLKKRLPLILNPNFSAHTNTYDEKTKTWVDIQDHSVDGQRKDLQYILMEDGSNLDELMYWYFCSDFNCLAHEFNMNHSGDEIIIDNGTAKMMLQACNYILSGKWSDELENILDNKWISVFTEGNNGNSYWPYVYRNNKKALQNMTDCERDDIKYTIVKTKYALETYLNSNIFSQYDHESKLILTYSISF